MVANAPSPTLTGHGFWWLIMSRRALFLRVSGSALMSDLDTPPIRMAKCTGALSSQELLDRRWRGPAPCMPNRARLKRIGVLLAATESDSEYPALVQAFVRELRRLGWTGANCTIDIRWAGGAPEGLRKNAGELVALAPDVILAPGNSTVGPLLQSTRSIPIVFVIVPDPVGAGFVESLARPGGNATGFESFEYNIGGKWIELLREIAPRLKRLAVFRDTTIRAGVGQWGAVQTAASSLGLETMPINLQDANVDRTGRRRLCAPGRWRPHRDIEWPKHSTSRSHHCPGGATQASRRLLR